MRKLVVLLFLFTSPAWADWTSGYVTADDVPVRTEPSPGSNVVTSLPRGQWLGVFKRSNGYAQIYFPKSYVSARSLDGNTVKTGGAKLLLDARPDSPVLGTLSEGEELEAYPTGEPFRQVTTPEHFTFWISDQYFSDSGLPVKEFVFEGLLKISDADRGKIKALKGLKIMVLPTDAPSQGELISSSDGRFGPSYRVKYQDGDEWIEIGAATDGLGGFGVNEPELIVYSPLLGKVVIGSAGVPQYQDLLTEGTALQNGSTGSNGPWPLTVLIHCSSGVDRQVLKRTVESLRASRI